MEIDKNGKFWIVTYTDGLVIFDPKTEKTSKAQIPKQKQTNQGSNYIRGIFKDSKQNIWLNTDYGLISYSYKTKSFTSYEINQIQKEGLFTSFCELKSGNFLVTTSNSLFIFDTQTKRFENTSTKIKEINKNVKSKITSVHSDSEGNILFNNKENLFYFNRKDYKYNKIQIKEKVLESVDFNHKNFIWIATNNGLYKINKENLQVSHYKHSSDLPNSLKDNELNKVMCDQQGNLWIGHKNNGLSLCNPKLNRFNISMLDIKNPELIYKFMTKAVVDFIRKHKEI